MQRNDPSRNSWARKADHSLSFCESHNLLAVWENAGAVSPAQFSTFMEEFGHVVHEIGASPVIACHIADSDCMAVAEPQWTVLVDSIGDRKDIELIRGSFTHIFSFSLRLRWSVIVARRTHSLPFRKPRRCRVLTARCQPDSRVRGDDQRPRNPVHRVGSRGVLEWEVLHSGAMQGSSSSVPRRRCGSLCEFGPPERQTEAGATYTDWFEWTISNSEMYRFATVGTKGFSLGKSLSCFPIERKELNNCSLAIQQNRQCFVYSCVQKKLLKSFDIGLGSVIYGTFTLPHKQLAISAVKSLALIEVATQRAMNSPKNCIHTMLFLLDGDMIRSDCGNGAVETEAFAFVDNDYQQTSIQLFSQRSRSSLSARSSRP